MFEMPPPRSYKRWRLRNVASGDQQDIIVHCPHEVRSKTEEVVLEPIPEYQIECGAVSLSQDKIAALALSLILKQRASLLKVRVEGSSGEIVTMEKMSLANFKDKYGDMQPRIANVLYSTLDQLEGLLPGKYVLHHDPSHGENAMLYSQKASSGPTLLLHLDIDLNASPPSDESTSLKTAPTLCDDLLPVHKFRRTLPCAFTPYKDQLPKHVPKTPARSKTPPQAIKWPRRYRNPKKK
ncbi:unnamed protein product [Leptosia nina]|uniref:Little elongation complex subunit 2 C-terminal domain-containing protein n=1 Tax=Leptosia nina TaxID=320188 RepID=A0AAV1JRR9_9NEOP